MWTRKARGKGLSRYSDVKKYRIIDSEIARNLYIILSKFLILLMKEVEPKDEST